MVLTMFKKALEIIHQAYMRFKALSAFFIPFVIGMIMLSLSWRKWADPIIDFGRELYIPWRISNGSVLYKDIAYFFGPLSAYGNALLFKIFGASLMVLAIFNIILIIMLTFIIYRIFFITTDKLTATAAASLFLAVFAFSQYGEFGNSNFVCPYTYGITYGIFLSFLIIYIFLIYLEKRDNKLIYLMGILLGLVFLAKPEIFFAITVAVFLGIFFLMFIDKVTLRVSLKIWSIILFGFLTPFVFFVVYLSASIPPDKALSAILLPYTAIFQSSVISSTFYKHLMGVDMLGKNIWKLFFFGGCYLMIVIVLEVINNLISFSISSKKWAVVGVATLLSLIFIYHVFIIISVLWLQIFRALPLSTLFLAGYLFTALCNARDDAKIRQLLSLFIMSVFAFCLLLKIIFSVYIFQYGFALAMPAALLLVTGLLYYLPIFLGKAGGKTYIFRILILTFLGFILFFHMNASRKIYNLKTCSIGSGGDTLFGYKHQFNTVGVASLQQAIGKIEKIIKKKESFVVFPEGVMLNYLTRRMNPTPYINFCPPELEIFGEGVILKSFMENKPDYFILMHRNMSEYGYPAPGKYWGESIRSWINRNYMPVFTSADGALTGRGSGFTIAKRITLKPE